MLRYMKMTFKFIFLRRRRGGRRPLDDEAKSEFTMKTTNKRDGRRGGDLEAIQESIEEAAKKVAHTTKSERDKEARRTPKKSQNWRRGGSKGYKSNEEKGTQETSKESWGRSSCEVQRDARKEGSEKKTVDGVVSTWQIHGRQRRVESRSSTTLRGGVYGS